MSVYPLGNRACPVYEGEVVTVGGAVLTYVSERSQLGQLTGMSIPNTRNRLWALANFIGPSNPVSHITQHRIERWLLSLKVSHATQRVYLSSIRAFTAWLVTHRYLRRDPAVGIDRPRQPNLLPPRALTHDQVTKVYLSCPDTRAELIVTLEVQQGLRAGEVAALETGDVDLDGGVLTVTGKGGNQRALPITADTASVLRRYFGEMRLTAGPLIRAKNNPHAGIKAATVAALVGRIMADAGLSETGHALRHTMASDLLDRGVHVRTVQYVLGHRSIATTQRYLRRFVGDLREAMEGRSYRP